MSRTSRLHALLPALVLPLLLAGCSASYTPTPLPSPRQPSLAPSSRPPTCDDPENSFEPVQPGAPGQVPSDSSMGRVADRGRMIVGVSSDTLTMAARDARTGDINGFEIDLARSLAEAILGPGGKLELRVVEPANAFSQVRDGEVDLVIDQVAMTCSAWAAGALSTAYLSTDLAAVTSAGGPVTPDTVSGSRACAPDGTEIRTRLLASGGTVITGRTWSDCLMKFQRGEADSLIVPRPIAQGLAAQDPYAEVGKDSFGPVSFAVLAPKQNVDMIRFVNAVLAQRVSSGEWQRSYDKWVRPYAGEGRPPRPQYGRAA